jgi:hypothetical protein
MDETTGASGVEAWANNGSVWITGNDDQSRWFRLDTALEVDELIAALEEAKRQAFPETNSLATH